MSSDCICRNSGVDFDLNFDLDEGFQLGVEWATQVAEFDDLSRVANEELTSHVGSIVELAEVATDHGDAWSQILFIEEAFGDALDDVSFHTVLGFLEGAAAVYREAVSEALEVTMEDQVK